MIYTGVKPVDIQEVKGLPEGLGKGGEGCSLEVLELGYETSITGFPASLESGGRGVFQHDHNNQLSG